MSSMKNKYIIRSRISEKKFREILKYFTEDIEASKISNLTKISEATLCKIFREIRILMSKEREKISKILRYLSIPRFDNVFFRGLRSCYNIDIWLIKKYFKKRLAITLKVRSIYKSFKISAPSVVFV